jgi:hypothetical protein
MKTKLFMIFAANAMLFALAIPVVVHAENSRIYFTGSEWCDSNTFIFARIWESGPNLHLDQITQTCYDTASIPRLTGTDYLFDARMNLVGGGPNFILSGKLRMVSDEGGVWVGSWVLPANTTTIQIIAHGEGLYEGQQLHWFLEETGNGSGPFSGYIEETGK